MIHSKHPILKFTRFFAVLAFTGVSAFAGDWTSAILVGDANSGINSALTYTTTVDFAGAATTINGVTFADTNTTGTNYSMGGSFNTFTGFANSVTGGLNAASSSFFYNGDGTGNNSITLTGLTVGREYVSSWYSAAFGGKRSVDITPSDSGTAFRINEDANISAAGNVLRYAFTATATSQTYGFDAVSNGDSFHHYAFTNAERNDAVFSYTHFTPVTPTVIEASSLSVALSPSNTDLLQTNLGSVTSTGNFDREPILGTLGVLTNGTIAIGAGANRPEMVTGENNATITFTLDTAVNSMGYDVSQVVGYGGWGDSGRDEQLYSVYVSLVGSSDYIYYGGLSNNPGSPGSPSIVRAEFNGAISGVDQVKITFLNGVENGFAGYGEFDVVGTVTIPEPSVTLSLGLLVGFCGLRRRR